MNNDIVFLKNEVAKLNRAITALKVKRIYQQDIIPKAVKQRHLEGLVIFTGIATDRPDGSSEIQAYFATDTNVLSLWNGTTWKGTTLS